jgi:hypothetical protein
VQECGNVLCDTGSQLRVSRELHNVIVVANRPTRKIKLIRYDEYLIVILSSFLLYAVGEESGLHLLAELLTLLTRPAVILRLLC